MVSLDIFKEEVPVRSRRFWKLRTSLLGDMAYLDLINKTIDETINKFKTCSNKGRVWDVVKMKIRLKSVKVCNI